MNTKRGNSKVVILALSLIFSSCIQGQPVEDGGTPTTGLPATTIEPTVPTEASRPVASITGVNWDTGNHAIMVGVNPWPETWSPWAIYVDGIEFPAGEES